MKTKVACLLMLLTILFIVSGCTNNPALDEALPPSSVQSDTAASAPLDEAAATADFSAVQGSGHPYMKDLVFLMEQLALRHPGFDRAAFQALVGAEADALLKMDEDEFNYAVCRIVAAMGDAHTEAVRSDQPQDRMIPIWQLTHYEDGWFIDGIHGAASAYLGCEVVEIADTPIDQIRALAAPYISHETEPRLDYLFAEYLKNSSLLNYLGVIQDASVIPMTLRDRDGKLFPAQITTYPIDDYDQYMSGKWIPFPRTGQHADFNYYFMPIDEMTLFIQYANCYEREDYPVASFREDLMQIINQGQYATVVFDLRYNTGGMYSLFQPLVDEIGESARRQDLALYCLIDGQTFSTGVMHAVQLKNYGATLVGRPTGGLVNFYADTIYFDLPNSGISVRCSTRYNENLPGYAGTSLVPDIPVSLRPQDLAQGLDADLQAVLDQLH